MIVKLLNLGPACFTERSSQPKIIILLFHKNMSTYSTPGTVLSAGGMIINRMDMPLDLTELTVMSLSLW